MENNFRTLISGILAKVSALYPKKSDVYTKQETDSKIPSKLTQLTNDAGFITADEVPEPVTSWNDLADKPFGEDEAIEWKLVAYGGNSQTGNITTFDASLPSPVTLIPEKTYKIVVNALMSGSRETIGVASKTTNTAPYYDSYAIGSVDDAVRLTAITALDGAISNFTVTLAEPIYSYGSVSAIIYEENRAIKTLDEKFIPDTIARVDDIPTLSPVGITGRYEDLIGVPVGTYNSFDIPVMEVTFVGNKVCLSDEVRTDRFTADKIRFDNTVNLSISRDPIYFNNVTVYGNPFLYDKSQEDNGGVLAIVYINKTSYWYSKWAYTRDEYSNETHVIAAYKVHERILDKKYLPDSVVLESELEAKGYQTESQVTTLINNALGVIENGTY